MNKCTFIKPYGVAYCWLCKYLVDYTSAYVYGEFEAMLETMKVLKPAEVVECNGLIAFNKRKSLNG